MRYRVAVTALALSLALVRFAAAQQAISTGTITGVVRDNQGLAVPGASIEARNDDTRQVRTTVSNDTGTFNIPALLLGRYTLRVTLTGFTAVEKVGIPLRSNETYNAGIIVLTLGQMSETVTVTAEAGGVETATAVRTAVVDLSTIESLVSRGRDPVRLLNALPGVDPSIGGTINGATIGTGLPTMQGTAGFNTYVAIDGVGSADGDTGNNNGMTSIDAIQEIRVVTNSYSAEYGRNSGPQVNIVTKSGTNKFSGTLSAIVRHEGLNSNTLQNRRLGQPKPIARFYTGVATVGGPVVLPKVGKLDQTFFFFTHEQWSTRAAASPNTKQMPTVAERAGDFSQTTQTTGAPFFIRDPLATGACSSTTGGPGCFSGNIIPSNRINPLGQAILNLFPKPNFFDVSVSNRQYNFQDVDIPNVYRRLDQITLDRNLTSNDRLQVKYRNWRPNRESTTGTFGINSNWNQFRSQYAQKEDAVTINHTHTLSSRIVNEASFGYRRTPEVAPVDSLPDPISKLQRTPNGLGSLGQLYHSTALNPLDLMPGLAFTGIPGTAATTPSVGYDGRFPIDAIDLRWTYQDNLSWTTGRHLFKFGAYYEYNINSEGFSANCFSGCLDFTSTGTTAAQNPFNTNHPYANALLGYYTTYTESNTRPFRGANQWQAEWFAQDSWKVRSRLTLELGMRFGRGAQWHLRKQGWKGVNPPEGQRAAGWLTAAYTASKNPRLYVPTCAPPATTCAAAARLAKDPITGAILPNSGALIGSLVPGSGDFYNGMVLDNDPRAFDGAFVKNPGVQAQPRFGFAWDPMGKGRTSIRGGWGITEQLFDNSSVFANTYPLQVPIRQQPTLFYGNLSDLAGTPAFNSPSGVVGWDPNETRVQKTYNYSFEVQQNVGAKTVITAAYVANRQRGLTTTRDINLVAVGARFNPANADPTSTTSATLADAFLRPIPQYTNVTVRTKDGYINYDSLQVTANRRMSNGFAAGGAYTLGKTLGMTGALTSVLDPVQRNYGYQGSDRRHILSFNWNWSLPKGSAMWNSMLTRAALDGWQLAGVGFMRSGTPSTVGFATSDAGGTDTMGGGDPVRVTLVDGCNPFLSWSDRTENRYFNTSCFVRTPRGSWGSNQPVIRQPGNKNLDLSLSKSFRAGRRSFQVRADAYNALSVSTRTATTAAQFDAAGNQVNSDFGKLALPTDEARQVELSVKFIW